MFANFIKTIWRGFLRHRLFTLINLSGLALGLTVTILMLTYVHQELSYDDSPPGREQIYRVIRHAEVNNTEYLIGVTSAPYGPALQNDFPASVTAMVRVLPDEGLIARGEHSFFEKKFYCADKNFFEFFSFPLAQGDPATALVHPNGVVLSTAMAHKYFGDEDPLGKTLMLDNRQELMVAGVLAPKQPRSHLDFDFMASLDLYKDANWFEDWWSNGLFTYVRLASSEEAANVGTALPTFIDKYLGEDFRRNGARIDPQLQPLSEIYFQNDVRYDRGAHGDRQTVYSFALLAVFILLLACVNYMNLTTARAGRRSREIGVRKVLGAQRSKLALQFFAESLMLTIAAALLALAAAEVLLPFLNATFGLGLVIDFTHPGAWLALVLLLLLVSFIASSYPALLLSSFEPATVLKSQSRARVQGISLRKGLVVFQFCVSIMMIFGTLVIGRQLAFMRNKALGFEPAHVILVPMYYPDIRERRDEFVARVRTVPGVLSASAMTGAPGGFHDTMAFEVEGSDRSWRMRIVFTDHDYVQTLGLKIVAGRDFARSFVTDAQRAVLLNETAVKMLGWSNEQALGKTIRNIMFDSLSSQVVGVLGDYNFSSLKDSIEPLAVALRPAAGTFAIRILPHEMQKTLAALQQHWQNLAPAFPFEFTFLDQALDQLYRREQREAVMFRLLGTLSIVIAAMGLFGLAAFAAEQRAREIGIRKVLGASMASVTGLLSLEFVKLVMLANIAAWPLAYAAMRLWLANFAYRVALDWWLFLLAGSTALLFALATVSTQALRAALMNPVEALRYE